MKHFSALLFIVVNSFFAFSQTVQENGQIKVYDSYQPAKGSSLGQKNKISLNPLGVLIGDYPIYYERMFGTTFSIEVGLGVTYENYFGNAINYGMTDTYSSEIERSYSLGNTYSISPKIYLDDDEFEGSYLALCYRHRLYNDNATGYSGTPFVSPIKEYSKLNSFTFNYGYIFTLGKSIILDYYVGIGLRFSEVSKVTETYNSSNTYPYNSSYTYDSEVTKKTLPTGMMGLKLGYTF